MLPGGNFVSTAALDLPISTDGMTIEANICGCPPKRCRYRHPFCRFPPNGSRLRQNFADVRKAHVEGRGMEAETGILFEDFPMQAEEFLNRGVVFAAPVERRTIIVVSPGKGTGCFCLEF
ncbi:MAG: hypothetical protein NT166_03170 [Candidatus Aminicenantes bacterium]|nr:hypothetical protein [Candidatus Aminicenantes bacterium]